MAIKLHRCSNHWAKVQAHPCWKVETALKEMGIEHELVLGPVRRSRREVIVEGTGQNLYPAIQFEDGTWYREQSKDMVARIRAGNLGTTAQSSG